MIKKITIATLMLTVVAMTIFPTSVTAITAEERLIEVERQLQAIAEQISKYEGEKTDLEKAIIQNDKDLNQVNKELAEVQSRLNAAQKALEDALANYENSLDNLAAVQQVIVEEQIKLGKIKNEITNVSDELFETQKELVIADEKLQEQAVSLYINGVMSPTTALFVDLDNLSSFLVALGYVSTVVDSAYVIVEQLNALQNLASTQTIFLTQREEEREEIVSNLQNEEEKRNQISIKAEDYADEVEIQKQAVEREKLQVENKKAQVLKARQNAQNLL
ncbi:MAG: hypothetical protein O3C71_05280, partial [Actinomycetota bacterium]|nr:hypothetical protein [Actinomycetota bacterium]